jgi:hypothetical protein
LIVTLSSGIIASLPELLNNPTSIPSILAANLPKASTFFLTYMILQGLAGTAGGFLQIVKLIIYYVKLILLGSTPRSIYAIKFNPGNVAWGTLFPSVTLLTVIGLSYSIISPIINGLAVLAFFLFYQLYKYLFLYVLEQDQRTDTGGLFFPKAIQHVFVGLYLQHICLTALFFLARDGQEKATSVPQGALMIVLIVLTAGFHAILNNSFNPLIVALPLSLKDRKGKGVSVEEKREDVDDVAENEGDVQAKRLEHKAEEAHADRSAVSPVDAEAGLVTEERRRGAPAVSEGDRSANASATEKDIANKKEAKEQNEVERYGFAHPAASRPQQTVWIPHFTPSVGGKKASGAKAAQNEERDRYIEELRGMSEKQVLACRDAGVAAMSDGSNMDGFGKIDVSQAPPGYAGL